MARLPTPGSDNNAWGTILNDFLAQAHKSDGTLKDNVIGATHLQDNAVTTAKLQDDAVTAAKLATADTPANGEVLTYSGGVMNWAAPAGGSGPQIFVQSTDPGVSAQDGDIWIDTSL
jgi:hypothetical protein